MSSQALVRTANGLYGTVIQLLARIKWAPVLLARITLAQVFIESGWGKLHHLEKVIAYFTQLGIPAPGLQAPFVATVELVGGLAVLLGAGTRIASVFLTSTMVVALLTAKLPDIHSFSDMTGMIEYLYITLFAFLIFEGAGPASVDSWIAKKFGR
jgi:putative oxidoreductase